MDYMKRAFLLTAFLAGNSLIANPSVDARRGFVVSADSFLQTRTQGEGYRVVSIGHSCVISALGPFSKVARASGYEGHLSFMQFFGGPGGAPEAQWKRTGEQQQAKKALGPGRVDVMTFGHFVGPNGETTGCKFEDYQRWMDLALEHNPDIRFYIQDLWPWLPTEGRILKLGDFKLGEYEGKMADALLGLRELIVKLDKKYPGRVQGIPVGLAMVELVRQLEDRKLPGVDSIVVTPKEAKAIGRVGLYRDMIHPTDLVAKLQGYIYLATIYGKNPLDLKEGMYPDPELDKMIRGLAWEITVNNPYRLKKR